MKIHEYVATLGVRPAELSGLKELPGNTKDHITPVLLLAPWLATSPLERALDKFEESFQSRRYFVDIDTYYQINGNLNEAKESWSKLAQSPANLNVWWDILMQYPNASPCLLMADQTIESARAQIDWARENSRPFCLRINFAEGIGSGLPQWMPELAEQLANEGTTDYAIIFEFGWVQDPLFVGVAASGYARTFFSTISESIPIVISCTSFPKDFTSFDGMREINFNNRALIEQVRQSTNHPRIIYGDWATTRPRSYGHASPPKKRIDYPVDRSWFFARDRDVSIDFQTAANRVVNNPSWAGDLGIWGEQLIEGTAAGQKFAIDSMQKMYSARINIHLHRQAFYGHLPSADSLDEEWNDDF